MIDYSAKAYDCIKEQRHRRGLSKGQRTRFESLMARSYTDDVDIRRGALSAPRVKLRPGQRDDEVTCTPLSMM